MSLNAAAIRILVAKGLTAGDLLAVAEAMETRSKAAERQSKYRERKKRDVTRDVTPPPYEEDTSTPRISPVEAKASPAPRGRDRGMKIPEDWVAPPVTELPPEARRLASQWPESSYRAEAEAFLNFWLTETRVTSRKSDWNRAWANRIVDVHGKVMRQAKFATDDTPSAGLDAKWTPEAKAAAIRRAATGPPGQGIGNVVEKVMRRVGNGQA